jgi:hypothetical protein
MIPLKATAIVSFVVVGFAYFWTPMPDDVAIQDRWLMRKYYIGNQAGKIVVSL